MSVNPESQLLPTPPPVASESPDLGFGSVVARESQRRLLNRDGTFNVRRAGLGFWRSLSPYHLLLTTTWPRFLGLVIAWYLVVNGVFAAGYLLCGPGALEGGRATLGRAGQAFFFSVETLATIGYGNISPVSLAAHLLVTVESLVGLIGFALAAGLVFARVSRPTAKIVFSDVALVAPFGDKTAFMFRIANARSSEIVSLDMKIVLSRRRRPDRGGDREFFELVLERRRVAFFSLYLTVVHPIDETSPLFGTTAEELRASDAEFLILLTGMDETFSQTVHARSSYKAEEVVFGARFKSIFNPPAGDGVLSVDIGGIHDYDRA